MPFSDSFFAPLEPFETEGRARFGDGNFCYATEVWADLPIRPTRVVIVSRDGQRIEIGKVEIQNGHPVLRGGIVGLSCQEIADWLNRERLGLSPEDVARITGT